MPSRNTTARPWWCFCRPRSVFHHSAVGGDVFPDVMGGGEAFDYAAYDAWVRFGRDPGLVVARLYAEVASFDWGLYRLALWYGSFKW